MNSPKTVAEARALPEERSFYTGKNYFGSGGIEGDDIILFLDTDGRSMMVKCIRYEKDGPDVWVKTAFSI